MTATFVSELAVMVLCVCCLTLLVAIGVQLDFGQPEHAGPTMYRNVMARHEQEQRNLHAEIQARRRARRERHVDDDGWKFNTLDFDARFASWVREFERQEPVSRSVFGTPETADEWVGAGR